MTSAPPPRTGIPDPFGHPRPPAAPATAGRCGYKTIVTHFDPTDARIPDRYRIGPRAHPPLEAVELEPFERWGEAISDTFWYVVLELAVVAMVWFHNAGASNRVSFTLVVVAMSAVFTAWIFRWRYRDAEIPAPIVAGSDWVGAGLGKKSSAMNLYELTQISIAPSRGYDGGENTGRTNLVLYDGRAKWMLGLDTALLEVNPELWALVYSGIRYSVDHGAEISRAARERLLIDPPPLDQPDE